MTHAKTRKREAGEEKNPTWKGIEIPLTSSSAYANPYAEIEVTFTFTGPHGASIVRPAFWDGGSVWKVRFAPTAVGTWKWHSACYAGYYDFIPTRPLLETEAMYERVDCGGVNTTDDARQSAWKAMLCGSAGYTYGGAGIWALKWDATDTNWKEYNHAIDSWHAGMAMPGVAQMTLMKNFFTALPWPDLTPRFNDPVWAEWTDPERCVLATIENQLFLAYCYGETATGKLKGLDHKATYSAQWFDPHTGHSTIITNAFSAPDGCWAVPNKPDGDQVLRVEIR